MSEYTTTGLCAVHGNVAFIPHQGGHDCFRCVAALEEITNPETCEAVVRLNNLLAAKGRAKLYIDANVWDGEDRAGYRGDSARFAPDELLEHLSS